MKKKNLHNWTRQDMTLAYYVAKWGTNGLEVESIKDLAEHVIESSVRSLSMQASNFRHLLNIEGSQLSDYSKLAAEIVEELANKTYTQVKALCNQIIADSDIKANKAQAINQECAKKRTQFKADSEARLQRELARYSSFGRRLRPLTRDQDKN